MEVPMPTPNPFRYDKSVLETQTCLLPNNSCLPNNFHYLSTYLGVDPSGWLYRWLAMEDQEFTACLSDRFVSSYISYCLHTYHFENILPPTICYTIKINFDYRLDPTPPTATPLPPTCTRLSPALVASPLAEATAPTALHRCKWSEDVKFVTLASGSLHTNLHDFLASDPWLC